MGNSGNVNGVNQFLVRNYPPSPPVVQPHDTPKRIERTCWKRERELWCVLWGGEGTRGFFLGVLQFLKDHFTLPFNRYEVGMTVDDKPTSIFWSTGLLMELVPLPDRERLIDWLGVTKQLVPLGQAWSPKQRIPCQLARDFQTTDRRTTKIMRFLTLHLLKTHLMLNRKTFLRKFCTI